MIFQVVNGLFHLHTPFLFYKKLPGQLRSLLTLYACKSSKDAYGIHYEFFRHNWEHVLPHLTRQLPATIPLVHVSILEVRHG